MKKIGIIGTKAKIAIGSIGVIGAGLAISAGVYMAVKTKPEQWQQNINEARRAHYGLDGNELISYVEDGAYNVEGMLHDDKDPLKDVRIVNWQEKEYEKTFYVYSYDTKKGIKFVLNKGESLAHSFAGAAGSKFAVGVESKRYTFNSLADRKKYEIDPVANAKLAKESTYTTGTEIKLGKYKTDYTFDALDATGQVETPALSFAAAKSLGAVKGMTKVWEDQSGTLDVRRDSVTMPYFKVDKKGNPIWNKDNQQFEREVFAGMNGKTRASLVIPMGMESISTGLQFVGHDVKVTDSAGKVYDFGTFQRYGNEFKIYDKDKDADADFKITSWW